MNLDLSQQVVLITGGSRGIGKAIVDQFAQSGATVALHYGNSHVAAQAIAASYPEKIHLFQADLSKPDAVAQLVPQVIQKLGRIDTLVNNAGIADFEDLDGDWESWQETWEKTLQVNLIASAMLCRETLPHFIAQGNGRIIHIASRAAFRGDTPQHMAYAASKGGMVALSKSIARGYGKQGIKSFVVAPGFTETEMAQQFIDKYGKEIVLHDLSLAELTQPEDVAPTVLFLASGHMDHATGTSIDINAGSYVR